MIKLYDFLVDFSNLKDKYGSTIQLSLDEMSVTCLMDKKTMLNIDNVFLTKEYPNIAYTVELKEGDVSIINKCIASKDSKEMLKLINEHFNCNQQEDNDIFKRDLSISNVSKKSASKDKDK